MSALAFNLITASILVLLVLAVRQPVARMFGARAAYALWLAPALRLVMPPMTASVPTADAAGSGGAVEWIMITERSLAETASWAVSSEALLAIWALGASGLLAWAIVRHLAFVTRALAGGRPLGEEDGIPVIVTAAVDGPVATGLFNRRILVPVDFETRFDPEQQRLALLHERTHHRRGDLWAMALALVGLSALWFNPFAYRAFAAFRRDMESACDATLLRETGSERAAAYGETIVRSAARPMPNTLCALTSFEELKGRLNMLKLDHGIGRRLAGAGLALALAGGGLALAMPASADGHEKKEVVKKKIIEKEIVESGDGEWQGKDGKKMAVKCPGELMEFAAKSEEDGKKEVNKIALCMKGSTNAEKIEGLEKALEKIGSKDDMNPAMKADLEAQIRAKIAELRG